MLGKKLINAGPVATGGGANTFASENFETVLYTGNGGTQRIGGYINRGGVFNGSSSKVQITTTAFNLQNMAVSMWINPSLVQNPAEVWSQRYYTSPYERGWMLRVYSSGLVKIQYTTNNSGYVDVDSSTNISANQWSHIVVVFDRANTSVKLYLNGTLSTSATMNADISYTQGGTTVPGASIGAGYTGYQYLGGKIDQLRVFNKALSSSEVTTLYGETYASSTVSTTDIFSDGSAVALYQLDGNANDTGGVSGKFGSAAIFNGSSSKVILPQSTINTLNSNGSFSVSFWFFANSGSLGSTERRMISLFDGIYIWIEIPANELLRYRITNSANTNIENTGATTITENAWHHVVLTGDSTNGIIAYLDNSVEISAASWDGTFKNGTGASRYDYNVIGAQEDDLGSLIRPFLGKIDDVRIYSDVLTSTEVGYIYNNTTASIPTDNLVAYYKLDGDARDEQQLYDGTATNVSYAYNGTATNVTYQEATKFQPDLVWIKDRSAAISHQIHDSVRGATKVIKTNLTNAESTDSAGLTSFDTNGFSIGANTGINNNTNNYVAWCWKAASSDSTNTDGVTSGSVTAVTSTVRANQDAGFSICEFTTPSSGKPSWGHGLSQAPELIIVKNAGSTGNWYVYAPSILGQKELRLNTTAAATSYTPDFISADSSKIDLGSSSFNIAGSSRHINYNFHSVDGYSKIGSYVGDGNESGNHIVTGFEPQFVMIKATENVSDWIIFDTERDSVNPTTKILYANLSSAEQDGITDRTPDLYIEVTSNGFQIKGLNNDINVSGETFIYLVIAADPDTTTPTVENSFDVVTYTGNGTSLDIITDFKPDLVWTKPRSYADNHQLWDTIRGAGWTVYSNSTNAQNPTIRLDGVSSFNDNGFSIGNWNNINVANETYVAWCWKAGDHDDNLPQINTEGTIDSVVSVNAAAGFSIVKWTGTGSALTVGHGLSSTPELIINKSISGAYDWHVYSSATGATKGLYLNDSAAAATSAAFWNNTSPTSTVFSVGTGNNNNSGQTQITYCFHSVSGYQKIGSYSGNSTSGTLINTGFQPRFVLIKTTNATSNWFILDAVRGGTQDLRPNGSNAEETRINGVTFVSNGFEIDDTSVGFNSSGTNYIYLAIA